VLFSSQKIHTSPTPNLKTLVLICPALIQASAEDSSFTSRLKNGVGNSHNFLPPCRFACDKSHVSHDEIISKAWPSDSEHLPSPARRRTALEQRDAGRAEAAPVRAALGSCLIPLPEREEQEQASRSRPESGNLSPFLSAQRFRSLTAASAGC